MLQNSTTYRSSVVAPGESTVNLPVRRGQGAFSPHPPTRNVSSFSISQGQSWRGLTSQNYSNLAHNLSWQGQSKLHRRDFSRKGAATPLSFKNDELLRSWQPICSNHTHVPFPLSLKKKNNCILAGKKKKKKEAILFSR